MTVCVCMMQTRHTKAVTVCSFYIEPILSISPIVVRETFHSLLVSVCILQNFFCVYLKKKCFMLPCIL